MDIDEFFRRYELAKANISETKLMEEAGLNQDAFRNARRRRIAPDLLHIIKICKVMEISPFYLLEPLGVSVDDFHFVPISATPNELVENADEAYLMKLWRKLGGEDQNALLVIIARMVSLIEG